MTTSVKKIKNDIPPSFRKALENIKARGFSHIKVELEARLGRGGSTSPCNECSCLGYLSCHECSGRGFIQTDPDKMPDECLACGGDGNSECRRCNGRGEIRGGYSDTWCRDYIVSVVRRETADAIVYGEFYWDGSVDSEYTFTLATEKAHLVIDVINAFKKLGDAIGNGVDIHNAGLHISVLPSGSYPCTPGLLNQRYMRNFRQETTKLLPALYFLATHDESTRGLGYRMPHVSESSKYSAIYTHGDTAIEYRLFDPCFDKPEAFYDKIEVIAQTLKYYSDESCKTRYEKFNMYDLNNISQIYGTMENYDALLKTIKEVKPDKSFTSLKAERYFTINKLKIKKLLQNEKKKWLSDQKSNYQRRLREYEASIARATQQVHQMFNMYSEFDLYSFFSNYKDMIANSGHTYYEIRSNGELAGELIKKNTDQFGIHPPAKPTLKGWKEYLASHNYTPSYILNPNTPLDEEHGDDEEDSY